MHQVTFTDASANNHFYNCCIDTLMTLQITAIVHCCPARSSPPLWTEQFLLQPLICGTVFHCTSLLPSAVQSQIVFFSFRIESNQILDYYSKFRIE